MIILILVLSYQVRGPWCARVESCCPDIFALGAELPVPGLPAAAAGVERVGAGQLRAGGLPAGQEEQETGPPAGALLPPGAGTDSVGLCLHRPPPGGRHCRPGPGGQERLPGAEGGRGVGGGAGHLPVLRADGPGGP